MDIPLFRTPGFTMVRNANEPEGKLEGLLRSYMQKLTDEKLMLRLSQVKKMDILDTTAFLTPPDNEYGIPVVHHMAPKEQEVVGRLGWYSIVPCFEEGAVKLNRFRYIVFKILDMDPEKQQVTIRLYDYMKMDGLWQSGVSTTMMASAMPHVPGMEGTMDVSHHMVIRHKDDLDFPGLYTMYEPYELGWSEKDWTLWMDTVVRHSRITVEELSRKKNTDACAQLASVFTKVISRCNVLLELNKPSRPVRAVDGNRTHRKCTVTCQDGDTPKRVVRNVGALRVQSEKIPRKPCLETVVTYKVARWTVRGHMRHYKSGKSVYVKPGTRTRKALADTGQATATTVRFRRKKT